MKIPPVFLFCLLPYATIAAYDESSTRKINLEDIEDDHIENERQSKSIPPPLSKQPAKGQPVQVYPPLSNEDYPIPSQFDTHRYSTRAQQHAHVQPLTDQPTAPAEAGYQHQQQSPAYHSQEIMYLPPGVQQQPLHIPQQLYDVTQHQPQLAPHFYYSHDLSHQQQTGNGNGNENDYQLQFVPIDQLGGSDGHQQQHSFHGPSQVTVPSTAAPVEPVSYSHAMTYDEVPQPEMQQHPQQPQQQQQQLQQPQQQQQLQLQQLQLQQPQQQQQQEPTQYLIANVIPEQNYAQHVYGLPSDVIFQSQKDIQYAQPAQNYGQPPIQYPKKVEFSQRDYSQDVTSTKPKPTPQPEPSEPSYQPHMSYSDQIKSVEYQSDPAQLDTSSSNSYRQNAKTSQELALSYGYENQLGQVSKSISEAQNYYLDNRNGFKYNQGGAENKQPAISEKYQNLPTPTAPTETQSYYLNHLKEIKAVHHHVNSLQKPAVVYGPPDTVGKEPQIAYGAPDAPFRQPVAQSNQDIYAPRRPLSAARSNGKPFAVSFPYPPSFVSFTTEKSPSEKTSTNVELSASNEVNPWRPMIQSPESQYRSFGETSESIEDRHRLPDLFHTRRAKSLLDSYIPSWLVTRMQEEQALQGQQGQGQSKQHSYTIPSPQTEDSYNTISYASHENIYGNHFKRSIPKKKGYQKKKVSTSNEEMTAME